MMDAHCGTQPRGRFMPRIDRNRCEGKGECIAVCPFNVFTLGKVAPEERQALTLFGKLRGMAHGWEQAFTPNAAACEACGHCVSACPERAITLVRVPGQNEPRHAPTPAD